MSRTIYNHMRTINAIQRDEINYSRPNNYGFTDSEFVAMGHKDRSRIVSKLKFLGFYTEADRLRDLARIKQQ